MCKQMLIIIKLEERLETKLLDKKKNNFGIN